MLPGEKQLLVVRTRKNLGRHDHFGMLLKVFVDWSVCNAEAKFASFYKVLISRGKMFSRVFLLSRTCSNSESGTTAHRSQGHSDGKIRWLASIVVFSISFFANSCS